MDECEIDLDNSVKNKRTFTGNVYDDRELLRKLAFDGMAYRYGLHDKTAYRRIEKELDIIERMGFCAYFLIAWEIVKFAMSQGFYHVGKSRFLIVISSSTTPAIIWLPYWSRR